jgi:hypothetical protein
MRVGAAEDAGGDHGAFGEQVELVGELGGQLGGGDQAAQVVLEGDLVLAGLRGDRLGHRAQLTVAVDPGAAPEVRLAEPLLQPVEHREQPRDGLGRVRLDVAGQPAAPPAVAALQVRLHQVFLRRVQLVEPLE